MIEGQDDLTWERFFRLVDAVEELGFAHMFRSDHLTALGGQKERVSLALWPSLTALALRTSRIRFGPMVCSVTFRQPAMVAKMAADISVLSNGRLDLGLGAGWHGGEHEMFGIDFPRYSTRLEMLAEGAEVIRALWSGESATYEGEFYSLKEAENYPLPAESFPALIMGGKGEKTLKVVARLATEWNCSYAGVDLFKEKSAELDANCEAIDRDPSEITRSLMIPFVIGRDGTAVQAHIDGHRQMFNGLPDNLADWRAAGLIGGSPGQVQEDIGRFEEAGVERFMLQQNALDDIDSLALLAESVSIYLE
jgi:alkanesulfonate monooxygenase SsuD/methylene tetrahydromethanopterin reductase-like flavin-dependent oxidoreductase (luciferase family)